MRRPAANTALALLASAATLAGPGLAVASASTSPGSGGGALGGGTAPTGSGSTGSGSTATGTTTGSSGTTGTTGSSGGTSTTGSGTASGGGTSASNVQVGSANQPVSANGSGISLSTMNTALLNGQMRISGTASGARSGEVVVIERSGRETGGQWEPTTQATPASNGSFTAVWKTNHIGQFAMRAVLEPAGAAQARSASASGSTSPSVSVVVYRPSRATLYGPGLYGKKTACGQTLTASTIGLANTKLPCGTKVALDYGGHTLVVPVIDRGPFANGADWDLTMATGKALGITGTETIGAVSLPAQLS